MKLSNILFTVSINLLVMIMNSRLLVGLNKILGIQISLSCLTPNHPVQTHLETLSPTHSLYLQDIVLYGFHLCRLIVYGMSEQHFICRYQKLGQSVIFLIHLIIFFLLFTLKTRIFIFVLRKSLFKFFISVVLL